MLGERISHYKILDKLGQGGMGVVYKAEDTKLKRTVALKFLSPELTRDPVAKERFLTEAQSAAGLNHVNIVTIYEINGNDSRTCIAMEYVSGKNLKQEIAHGPLPVDKTLKIVVQVAEGLQEAHEKGIIHRDIKSANIMIDEKDRVKIMDFGLAGLKGQQRVTEVGTPEGTVSYMSPEQSLGIETDHRTDIWSLGVVLFEMLTGQLPFKGDYEQAVIYSILNESAGPLPGLQGETGQALQEIVDKALAKDLDERYPLVSDLLNDLRKVEKELETAATEERSVNTSVPSIAVLPFVDMSPQKDQEYFCDGMAEELINSFAKIEGLYVASRTSAFQFKEKGFDINQIYKKLKVQTVLEGSVRKAGNRLRITAQLINAADGYQIWSEKYDRTADDIFAIQDEISMAIVKNLKVKLMSAEKRKLIKRYTQNQEAYNLYLKGLYFWNRRCEGGLQKAFEFFQQAIEIDPNYAVPYVGIADVFNLSGYYGFLPAKVVFPKAKTAARKALEIDNTMGEACASLGWVNTMFDWDWTAAEQEFKKSIKLNPNYATAYHWYAVYLMAMGRSEEAIAEVRKAQVLEPLSLIINTAVGIVLWLARKYDEAVKQFQNILEMDPDFQLALYYLGITHGSTGKYEDAIVSLEKVTRLPGGMIYAAGPLGMFYALSGQREKALKMIDQIDELSVEGYSLMLKKAYIYTGLGETDRAFEFLEKAYVDRESELVFFKTVPLLDTLRVDSRFDDLLKKIGLEK